MNEESRPARRLPNDHPASESSRSVGRRWWEHPEDLSDSELMLIVRSMVAVDQAVDRVRRAA
jgi:hypothetical protein